MEDISRRMQEVGVLRTWANDLQSILRHLDDDPLLPNDDPNAMEEKLLTIAGGLLREVHRHRALTPSQHGLGQGMLRLQAPPPTTLFSGRGYAPPYALDPYALDPSISSLQQSLLAEEVPRSWTWEGRQQEPTTRQLEDHVHAMLLEIEHVESHDGATGSEVNQRPTTTGPRRFRSPTPTGESETGRFLEVCCGAWSKRGRAAIALAVMFVVFMCTDRSLQGHHCQPASEQPTHSTTRWKSIARCVHTLSKLNDEDEWDPNSMSYRTAMWFMGPGFRVPVECARGSFFATLYALLVLRDSVNLPDSSWYHHDNEMAVAMMDVKVCHWARVQCSDEGQVSGLVLNHANLTGQLPSEMGGLVHLEHLHLFDNAQLVGRLPTEIGQLTKLTSLQVHKTLLGGQVPSEMGLLTHLQEVLLEDTLLTGRMPVEVCSLRLNDQAWLTTLRATCTRLECSCCTECH